MPKKFLLYIYNPNFEKEKKKSHLVNKLLDSHYEKLDKKKTVARVKV